MWILQNGIWEDSGIWDDADVWRDAPAVGAGVIVAADAGAYVLSGAPASLFIPVIADLDALEIGDSLQSIATVPEVITIIGGFSGPGLPKLPTIYADLKVRERRDTCIATATLGPNPVELDNNLLLLAS